MGKGLMVSIYMDSQYAFATAHIHGVIYQARGLLTEEGKAIKNKEEILCPDTSIKRAPKVSHHQLPQK